MPISPAGSLLNIVAGLPAQAPAATGPASPAAKAAEAALAARTAKQQAQAQSQALTVPTLTAEAHKAVANLPRGSFLNIVV
ncbi:MAG: hypothetical protein ACK4NA_06400 [Alphaproteobacteria bacterium]